MQHVSHHGNIFVPQNEVGPFFASTDKQGGTGVEVRIVGEAGCFFLSPWATRGWLSYTRGTKGRSDGVFD